MRIEEAWAKLQAAADVAARRGSLIFHLDLATEVARAAFVQRGIGDEALATLVDDIGYRVFAFDEAPTPRARAEARFDASGDAIVLPTPTVPPRAWTVAQARRTIAATALYPDRARATIVVPAHDRHAPLEGYALAIADGPDTMLAGDHWLLTLDPAGQRVIARQPLAAAIDPAPHDVRARRDVTLVDAGAVPNELHTYLSLKHGIALLVETRESGARWRVDGERTAVLR